MNWLLVLHIIALLFWVAGLIYIPALLAVSKGPQGAAGHRVWTDSKLPRVVFTHAVTPFALTAIIAGTLVFVFHYTIGTWLIVKLTLVVMLVLNHVLLGFLVIRAEAGSEKPVRRWCLISCLLTCALAVAVLWVVLAKPAFGSLS